MLETVNGDPDFMNTVITGDESWVYGGLVHHEYAPHGTTITKEYYQEVLRRLRDAVRRKRPDLWAQAVGSSIMITLQHILPI
ncbi:Uncharacterized protein FKW44_004843 [Caligus rogercresseyi]|uniref:Uncharacterized protein n=1 Tax=Caligus rogercresseyi TaxID=217165 RepID=A0A7T8HM57_CALRO|nr:Uncharacterized protein FKW44_004843 [Caligus rogercresseyi]